MTQIIHPKAKNRIAGLFCMVCALVVGGMLWEDHGFFAFIVWLIGVGGGGGMLITGYGDANAACPLCGKSFQLGLSSHQRCPWCFGYSQSDEKRDVLSEVEAGRIEKKPTFLLPLPKTYRLPQICCACGRVASGSRVTHATYNIQHDWLPAKTHIEYSLDIPYCKVHGMDPDGPGVETALDHRAKKAGAVSLYAVPGFKVSSYQFYCEYLRLNGIKNHFDPQLSV